MPILGVTCGVTGAYFGVTELRPISLILAGGLGGVNGAEAQNPCFGVPGLD